MKKLLSIGSLLLMILFVTAFLSACGNSGGGGSAAPATTAPTAPTDVTATPGNTQVALAWAPVSGATSYNVYWRATAGVTKANGTKIAGVSNPYIQTSLPNGTDYYCVITAVNAVGESADSAQAHAIPATNPTPAAPLGIYAAARNGYVWVNWYDTAGATSYNLYWSTTAGVTKTTGTKVANVASGIYQPGTNGTHYYYVVTAQNANGESTESAQMSATPAPTTGPSIYASAGSYQGGTSPVPLTTVYLDDCTFSGMTLTTAVVTVNGVSLPYNASNGDYEGNVVIPLGGAANVSVTVNGNTYAASGTQYTAYPTINAPASGATWDHTIAHTLSWSGGTPTAGASYAYGISDSATSNLVYPAWPNFGAVPVSTPSVTIPANSLTTGSRYALVAIGTGGAGIPIPNACPGSGLYMYAVGTVALITVN